MVKRLLLVLMTIAACGLSAPDPTKDQETSSLLVPPGPVRRPCNRTSTGCVDLYVVAHPDDDLLFMNPDIQTSISSGNRVVVVIENGSDWNQSDPNRTEASQYWIDRERGSLNAYAFMAKGASGAFDHYVGFSTASRSVIPTGYTQRTYCGGSALSTFEDVSLSDCSAAGGVSMPQFDITSSTGSVVTLLYLHLQDEYVIDLWVDPLMSATVHHVPESRRFYLCVYGECIVSGASNQA